LLLCSSAKPNFWMMQIGLVLLLLLLCCEDSACMVLL
jgi:hypothetical protein